MAGSVKEGTDWLKSLSRFGEKPGLERTRRVLEELGNPQDGLEFLHIAGTNGKGSVCAYLTALLSETLTVGTFTSPAFDGYRGRFMVGKKAIEPTLFDQLANDVRDAVARVTPADPLTEFEVLTVMAILHFKASHVDVVVWETGLGGRFDSTNVVEPLVTAITNVSYDHVEILGDTLAKIAYDKAGIIKPGVPIITGAIDEAYTVIKRVAADVGAPLYHRRSDFGDVRLRATSSLQYMAYRGIWSDVASVPIPLFGAHQCENAAIALAVYEVACERAGWTQLTPMQVCQAMQKTDWPGRFEIIQHRIGPVIFDGAHNAAGADTFAAALDEFIRLRQQEQGSTSRQNWTFVIGILRDKEVERMLESVLPYASRVIAAAPGNARALPTNELAELIRTRFNRVDVVEAPSIEAAMRLALQRAEPIACLGSLYTVDEARNAIQQEEQ